MELCVTSCWWHEVPGQALPGSLLFLESSNAGPPDGPGPELKHGLQTLKFNIARSQGDLTDPIGVRKGQVPRPKALNFPFCRPG